jgi:hypothetical protein
VQPGPHQPDQAGHHRGHHDERDHPPAAARDDLHPACAPWNLARGSVSPGPGLDAKVCGVSIGVGAGPASSGAGFRTGSSPRARESPAIVTLIDSHGHALPDSRPGQRRHCPVCCGTAPDRSALLPPAAPSSNVIGPQRPAMMANRALYRPRNRSTAAGPVSWIESAGVSSLCRIHARSAGQERSGRVTGRDHRERCRSPLHATYVPISTQGIPGEGTNQQVNVLRMLGEAESSGGGSAGSNPAGPGTQRRASSQSGARSCLTPGTLSARRVDHGY